MMEAMTRYARKGWVTVSYDARYHGERHPDLIAVAETRRTAEAEAARVSETAAAALDDEGDRAELDAQPVTELEPTPEEETWSSWGRSLRLAPYVVALKKSWLERDDSERESPFVYDSAHDASRVLDVLLDHPEFANLRGSIDTSKIGITGVSLGGMIAWFAAASDTRFTVAAPAIGVQGFKYALDHNKWGPRVDSLKAFFDNVLEDVKKKEGWSEGLNSELVGRAWDAIVPGIRSDFDSPFSLALIAPRPLLIINGGIDDRTPPEGVEAALDFAKASWDAVSGGDGAAEWKTELVFGEGVGHEVSPQMWDHIDRFFDENFEVPPGKADPSGVGMVKNEATDLYERTSMAPQTSAIRPRERSTMF